MIRPVIKEIQTDKTSFDIYMSIKNKENIVFLDSGKDFRGSGRYSFIGLEPFLRLKGNTRNYFLNDETYEGDVLEKISEILNKYKCEKHKEFPFVGGGMGYFSYDLGREFEKLPEIAEKDVHIPEAYFVFYDGVLIFDNLSKKTYVSALGITKDKEKLIKQVQDLISNAERIEESNVGSEIHEHMFGSNFGHKEYTDAVERTRRYIKTGDIYIMNMSQRFTCDIERESCEVYKDLRSINPAQFGGLMKLEGFDILSCSPERFLSLKDGVVQTRPIKGTRPRGETPEEDMRNRRELMNSEKDKSELLMIVDLERNDLSRVCKKGTIEVTELFEIEEYPTVFHLVSNIRGEIKEDKDIIDCIRVAFPGGSITGAPKIRAMEIIDELEKVRRNIYTGSIGYLGFDGGADVNIVIRTIMIKDGTAYFGAGGGITWESELEFEYEETFHKAKALMRALSSKGR